MFDTSWDIEKYKTAHESDEHWELKHKFMAAHKETLPEDELVCMAQVFANIEFLGCRYPNETMARVAELAKGVVEEFREKKKHTLKRTFVAASDAASSKVKGLGPGAAITPKRAKQDDENQHLNLNCKIQPGSGLFGNFVLILSCDMRARNILDRSVALNRASKGTRFESVVLEDSTTQATYYLKGEKIAEAVGGTKKLAIDLVAESALEKLRKICYSVLIKGNLLGKNVEKSDIDGKEDEKLSDNNIGSKLMKMMGWTGGGLGSSAQGIQEPITAVKNVQRAGFGSISLQDFRRAVRDYLQDWINQGAESDLSFSSDFDREHRKIIHEVGLRFDLKTQSYGNEGNRRLIVSKKIHPWDLVQKLAEGGDKSNKYELLPPGSDFSLEST